MVSSPASASAKESSSRPAMSTAVRPKLRAKPVQAEHTLYHHANVVRSGCYVGQVVPEASACIHACHSHPGNSTDVRGRVGAAADWQILRC